MPLPLAIIAASKLYSKSIYKLQDKILEGQIERAVKEMYPVIKRALWKNEKKGFLLYVKIYRAAMGGGKIFGGVEACGVGPTSQGAFLLSLQESRLTSAKPKGAIGLDYSLGNGSSHFLWFTMKGGYLFPEVISGVFAKKIIDDSRGLLKQLRADTSGKTVKHSPRVDKDAKLYWSNPPSRE